MIEFKLTQKQEAFCLAYIETGNASEAYRRSYDAAQMLPSTVNRKAVELMDNAKVAARLAELREPAVKNAQITLESHLAKLAELRDAAQKGRDYGAAIRAEIARGKAAGLYIERVEVEQKVSLADLLGQVYEAERAELPRMLQGEDPIERRRAEVLQEQERRRAALRGSAERLSASELCPATDGAGHRVTTHTITHSPIRNDLHGRQ